jgi:hypothetical protein
MRVGQQKGVTYPLISPHRRDAIFARVSDWFLGDGTGVKRFDQQIGGKILLADSALEVEHLKRTLDAEMSLKTSTGLSNHSSAEDLSLDESGRLVHTLKLGGPDSSAIFSLGDPAILGKGIPITYHIYPDENRVSFVFLLCANPTLNGTVVHVEDKQQCNQFESEAVRGADWFLHVRRIWRLVSGQSFCRIQ